MSEKSPAKKRKGIYNQGYIVALGLAALTGVEYVVAVTFNSAIVLLLISVAKAYLVINYFMHISTLWSSEEEH